MQLLRSNDKSIHATRSKISSPLPSRLLNVKLTAPESFLQVDPLPCTLLEDVETLFAHNAYQLRRLDSAEGFAGLLWKHRGQGQRDHLAVKHIFVTGCVKITQCACLEVDPIDCEAESLTHALGAHETIETLSGCLTSEHGNLGVRQGNCSKLSPSVDVDIASRTDLQLLPPLPQL